MASSTSQPPDFVIGDLRGGVNIQDPPHAIPDNQVMVANNVEFFKSTLGERRLGCLPLDLDLGDLANEAQIVFLGTYQPESSVPGINDYLLFAVGATGGSSVTFAVQSGSGMTTLTPPDPAVTTSPSIYSMDGVSFRGKFFIGYAGSLDRLYVYDGTTFRTVGLGTTSDAPTAVDTGSGTFTGDRTYRVRFLVMSGSDVVVMSEPSGELVFTPSGSGNGAIVTRPSTLPGEGETHWVMEASSGDGNFYQLAIIPIGTTTYTDTYNPATEYAVNAITTIVEGGLSPDIGDYTPIPSGRFIKIDQDRLIIAGSFHIPDQNARIRWTPVTKADGVGNDERTPIDIDSYIDLNPLDNGVLTGISSPIQGSFYAFKLNRIYHLQRTGDVNEAYEAFLISDSRGAIMGSIVNGVDEAGAPCIYFLDPQMGPSRIGREGLQYCNGLRNLWRDTVNKVGYWDGIAARGCFYPLKQQVHWWVPTGTATTPNYKIIAQTSEMRSQANGTTGGWVTADGKVAEIFSCTVFPERDTNENGVVNFIFRPYLGMASPDFIQRMDVGETDNGEHYRALIRTKPYFIAGLINRWGAMRAALLARANTTAQLVVKFIRDFGLEENHLTTGFAPIGSEEHVIKDFDNLVMSSSKGIQVEFSDPDFEQVIEFLTDDTGLTRDGSFLTPSTSWTKSGWFRAESDPGSGYIVFRHWGSTSYVAPYVSMQYGTDTVSGIARSVYVRADSGAGDVRTNPILVSADSWVYLAARYNGTTHEIDLFVNSSSPVDAITVDLSAASTSAVEKAGMDTGASVGGAGMAYLRDWQAYLTDDELIAEAASQTAVRTTNLLADTSLQDGVLTDASGNGRDWTAVGSPTIIDGPI